MLVAWYLLGWLARIFIGSVFSSLDTGEGKRTIAKHYQLSKIVKFWCQCLRIKKEETLSKTHTGGLIKLKGPAITGQAKQVNKREWVYHKTSLLIKNRMQWPWQTCTSKLKSIYGWTAFFFFCDYLLFTLHLLFSAWAWSRSRYRGRYKRGCKKSSHSSFAGKWPSVSTPLV